MLDQSLRDMQVGLRSRAFSSRELVAACLDRLDRFRHLNAFITETPERALRDADRADENLRGGTASPLEGIPVAVKDIFCTEGIRTTAGSRILANFVPGYESAVTARLWKAGAVLVGKTNMDEFAMGSSSTTGAFGPVASPLKRGSDGRDLTAGGSSGGSAAAVRAGIVPGALGSDTGGSVRQPASMCGIVGMKPTYGRCSRWGMVAYASSLDQAGVLTRTVGDAATLLEVIAGRDDRDSTSADVPVPPLVAAAATPVARLRYGIPRELSSATLEQPVREMWDRSISALLAAGADVVDVSVPLLRHALPSYYIIATAEASSNLARYDGVRYGPRAPGDSLDDVYFNTRGSYFGNEVKRRVMLGTFLLSAGYYDAFYNKAQKVRRMISDQVSGVMRDVDALLFPTSPIAAFPREEKDIDRDAVSMYLIDIFTIIANLTGLPAISVPFGADQHGMPLGMQVLGRAFEEGVVLRSGQALMDHANG